MKSFQSGICSIKGTIGISQGEKFPLDYISGKKGGPGPPPIQPGHFQWTYNGSGGGFVIIVTDDNSDYTVTWPDGSTTTAASGANAEGGPSSGVADAFSTGVGSNIYSVSWNESSVDFGVQNMNASQALGIQSIDASNQDLQGTVDLSTCPSTKFGNFTADNNTTAFTLLPPISSVGVLAVISAANGNMNGDFSGLQGQLQVLIVGGAGTTNLLVPHKIPNLVIDSSNIPDADFQALLSGISEIDGTLTITNNPLVTACDLTNTITSMPQGAAIHGNSLLASINLTGYAGGGSISSQSLQMDLSNNAMDDTAINFMFTGLGLGSPNWDIAVTGNPGAATCNPTIATLKGWNVVT